MSVLKSILHAGVSHSLSKSEKRAVILCNSFCIAFALIPFVFTFLVWLTSGSSRFSWPLLIQPLVMLTPIPVNALGFTRISRILLSWLVPAIIVTYSVYNKLGGIDIESSSYVGFRLTMISATMVPFLLFNTQQIRWMVLAAIVPIAIILGFDPIHSAFGVGYHQVGLSDQSYELSNIRSFITIVMIGSISLILKRIIEKSENENTKLVEELQQTEQKLKDQLENVSQQNELIDTQNQLLESRYQSILKSQQYLIESKESLALANEIIANQKQLLADENRLLEMELLNRNKELEKSVKDLIQSNNNLMQYSFMVSHNLRGPVASFLGLLNIVPVEKLDPELKTIYEKALKTGQLLDSVISDINTVLDVQKNNTHIRQKIYWEKLVNRNLNFFRQEIETLGIKIKQDFTQAPYIISIQPILDSIVYNLISNAIKFRSPTRPLVLQFETVLENESIDLRVTDNGLGINLETQRGQIFKMYKRLHNHVEGKGLGLYMVKIQTEFLNGTIDVASQLDQFTTFSIRLPINKTSDQVLLDKDYGTITFNALNNSTEIHFKRNFTSAEYREIYQIGLDYFKRLNIKSALADLTQSHAPEEADQYWLLNHIAPEASKAGLRKVAIVNKVTVADPQMVTYLAEVNKLLESLSIEQRIFQSHQEATEWLTQ